MMKSNLVAGKPALFLCLSACGITSAASTVFFRFRRNFVSGGKSAEKTSIEKSKWVLSCYPLTNRGTPAPARI